MVIRASLRLAAATDEVLNGQGFAPSRVHSGLELDPLGCHDQRLVDGGSVVSDAAATGSRAFHLRHYDLLLDDAPRACFHGPLSGAKLARHMGLNLCWCVSASDDFGPLSSG